MNASVANRFLSFGGPCVAHGVAGCAFCLGNAPARASLDSTIATLLELLPLEARFDDLRCDVLRIRLNATQANDGESRRRLADVIRFHFAPGPEPWRVRLHEIAEEVERG